MISNGHAKRKLSSWIDAFVKYTDNLESPEIFRRWVAISAIGATLEQKVWIQTSEPFYPNLYTVLVGHPGGGKTRSIMAARKLLKEIPELHIAPTSIKMASLVDCLVAAKRIVINIPHPPLEFNSLILTVDEFGAFMHKFDEELVDGLTTLYDVTVPYSQQRRTSGLKIKIDNPQLSIMAGSTPANLLKFMPEIAWDQGFTSRIILVYSGERSMSEDVFGKEVAEVPKELIHDLKCIHSLIGPFNPSTEYRTAISNWTKLGLPPVPKHPKLTHYCTRRRGHLFKLSMVASVDRGDDLTLTKADFNRAMGWLLDAEAAMPEIFRQGTGSTDAKAMDEIAHFIESRGTVKERELINFARERIPVQHVIKVLEIMERSGLIKATSIDPKTGLRLFSS